MAKKAKVTSITYHGITATRGERMTKGPWRLMNKNNKKVFVGSLIRYDKYRRQKISHFQRTKIVEAASVGGLVVSPRQRLGGPQQPIVIVIVGFCFFALRQIQRQLNRFFAVVLRHFLPEFPYRIAGLSHPNNFVTTRNQLSSPVVFGQLLMPL